MEYAQKLESSSKKLGFDAVQFHDDDIVPADMDWPNTKKGIAAVKKVLDGEGLSVEIVAPRLWEDPRTIDGAFTSNDPGDRKYALDRARRCVDIAREIGCKNYVLWLAREGSYIREAKCAKTAIARIVEAWNAILEHDREIRVLGEAKPNEPMDQAYLPTVGHMVGVAYATIDPGRSGVLIEKPPDRFSPGSIRPMWIWRMPFYHSKLWSVHLERPERAEIRPGQGKGSVDRAGLSTRSGSSKRTATAVAVLNALGPRRQGHAHHDLRGINLSPFPLKDDVPAAARRGARN